MSTDGLISQDEAQRFPFELVAVAGLRYRQDRGTLRVMVSDPANRNALRRPALDSLCETCARFHELPFERLLVEFDTSSTSVACAGLNLKDFEEAARQVADGEDLLPPDHYFVRATRALRSLSKAVPTAALVSGHLVGAGVELALSCGEVTCARPESKLLLPHLRIGVPYHTSGLGLMASIMGWDVLSQAMVTDAIPVLVSRVLADRASIGRLSAGERIRDAKIALERLAAVYHGRPVKIGSTSFVVEDRTGKTQHIAEAHLLQIMTHVLFGGEIANVPPAVQELIDAPRIRASYCAENRVPASIAAHRRQPKELNRCFSKNIGTAFDNHLDEPIALASAVFGGSPWTTK